MEGLGNDFIMLDDRKGEIAAILGGYPQVATALCSRHFGIGGDGIILLLGSDKEDAGFRIFNCDGSEAQMCGNGMRCFAKYLFENKIITKKRITVETRAGRVIPEIITDASGKVQSVCVDMGEPVLDPAKIPFVIPAEQLAAPDLVTEPIHIAESTQIKTFTQVSAVENASDLKKRAVDIPLNVNGKTFNITVVSMGNPHAVIFVDDISSAPVKTCGKEIENHPSFPEKTNVEFIQIIDRKQMHMRVWERGAGETLACGTGASAALVAACLNGKSEREATIHLSGGDLKIEWRESDNHIYKTGPAKSVFRGSIDL
ncbi:MAG: diaminopimelate epimerase [Desulfamplus sp.]|nr:diaminopimelate epimerase [Desulfamplus sp.]